MCLFATAYRKIAGCPVLVLINRDEFRTRPTALPQLICDHDTRWFGGTDLQAGGTWLGVNQFGLVVGVTNRKKADAPKDPRSRGWLCRDLLQCRTAPEAHTEAQQMLKRYAFDGFNLLLVSADAAIALEAGDEYETTTLSAGVHCIGNGSLNDSSERRLDWTRREIERVVAGPADVGQLVLQAQQATALRCDDEWDSICRLGAHWGTVSSTIIALPDAVDQARYYYAPGPPHNTPFQDYSATVQSLLQR